MIESVDVALIGAGISGLTLAFRLSCLAPAARIAVLEASDRPGGKTQTRHVVVDGGMFVIEAGPDAWIAQKPWAADLVCDLGLGDDLIPIQKLERPVAILKGGRRIPLPHGTAVVAPTDPEAAERAGLLSVKAETDLVRDRLPDTLGTEDESLQAFVERRFGRETLDWIAEPLAAGIYNADPAMMSMDATFPLYRRMARENGGVIATLQRAARGGSSHGPAFLSLRRGMQSLTDALAMRLGDRLIVNAPVMPLRRADIGGFLLEVLSVGTIHARQVVVALPARVAAGLLGDVAPDTAALLRCLRETSTGAVSLAVRSDQIQRPLEGYGLVIPAREGRAINALTVSSRKFAGRAPEGWTLMRAFFGGYRSPGTFALADDRLIEVVLGELRDLIGLSGDPSFVQIDRWPDGSPQYDVGHLDRVREIEDSLPDGISAIGSAYRGVGIPDLIRNANETAERLAQKVPGQIQAQPA